MARVRRAIIVQFSGLIVFAIALFFFSRKFPIADLLAAIQQHVMLWVAIGQAPGLFLYPYLGTLGQLGLNLARGTTHPRLVEYFIWLGGFASAALVLAFLGRIALRLLQQAERDAAGRAAEKPSSA